jgi:hypothetical protein
MIDLSNLRFDKCPYCNNNLITHSLPTLQKRFTCRWFSGDILRYNYSPNRITNHFFQYKKDKELIFNINMNWEEKYFARFVEDKLVIGIQEGSGKFKSKEKIAFEISNSDLSYFTNKECLIDKIIKLKLLL